MSTVTHSPSVSHSFSPLTAIPINSKIYFYSIDNGEFLGEIDAEYKNNRTILVSDSEYPVLSSNRIISLKIENDKLKGKHKFDWTNTNRGGLPSLGELIHKYPTNSGGIKQAPSVEPYADNQCAIRISRGLIDSKYSMDSFPDLKTREGFARSAQAVATWLAKNVFWPKIYPNPSSFDKDTAHGIIFLWDKSPGGISHIDVIYYGQTGSGYYGSDEIHYWELK